MSVHASLVLSTVGTPRQGVLTVSVSGSIQVFSLTEAECGTTFGMCYDWLLARLSPEALNMGSGVLDLVAYQWAVIGVTQPNTRYRINITHT